MFSLSFFQPAASTEAENALKQAAEEEQQRKRQLEEALQQRDQATAEKKHVVKKMRLMAADVSLLKDQVKEAECGQNKMKAEYERVREDKIKLSSSIQFLSQENENLREEVDRLKQQLLDKDAVNQENLDLKNKLEASQRTETKLRMEVVERDLLLLPDIEPLNPEDEDLLAFVEQYAKLDQLIKQKKVEELAVLADPNLFDLPMMDEFFI